MDLGDDEYFQDAFDDDGADLGNFDEDAATAYLNEVEEPARLKATDVIYGGNTPVQNRDENISPKACANLAPAKRRYYDSEAVEWYFRQQLEEESPKCKKVCYDNEQRALEELRSEPMNSMRCNETSDVLREAREQRIFHTVPVHTNNWTPITGIGLLRERYYITNHEEIENQAVQSSKSSNLLAKPYEQILREAEGINKLREKQELFGLIEEESEPNRQPEFVLKDSSNLWVEKYRPRIYTDLLSDDGINRTLLTWLKLWDECVFGKKTIKKKVVTEPPPMTNYKAQDTKPSFNKSQDTKPSFKSKQFDLPLDTDKIGRPLMNKVALLCGPPGLGKTTLATVVCRHAGYHVTEMNASDDRSVELFKNNIAAATQMKRTLDADPKPSCLLIDEIDGAPAPSINYLVSLVQGEVTLKGKTNRKQTLKRPIICICNDLYTPALRELRKVALVLHFPSTAQKKLAERLEFVCRMERIQCEIKALQLLADKSSYDIRTCLNSLQFASGECNDTNSVNVESVRKMKVGQKDHQSTLFNLWHDVFNIPKHRKSTWRYDLLSAVFSVGEGDRVRQGIFENYPMVNQADPNAINAASSGLQWLTFSDCVSRFISKTQNYQLMTYEAYVPLVFHDLFATKTYTRVQFPRGFANMKQNQMRCASVLESILIAANCRLRQFCSPVTLAMDITPFIMHIIVPNIRLVNTELYGPKEKCELGRVVDAMIYFGLQYRQQIAAEGQYQFVLEPAIEEISDFKDLNKRIAVAQTARLLISRELNVEKMKRNDRGPVNRIETENEDLGTKNKVETKVSQKPKVQQIFGSRMKQVTVSRKHTTEIWYKFNQGHTNAIRRNIKMTDILNFT